MRKKKKLYYWASDIRTNSGEGVLANQFTSDIRKYYKNSNLININKYNKNYHTFYNKYFLNFIGAIKLWHYHWSGHKTMYINYYAEVDPTNANVLDVINNDERAEYGQNYCLNISVYRNTAISSSRKLSI